MDREKVAQVIETVVRPVLNAHNGDVELVELTDEGVARVRLLGACSSCGSAQVTLSTIVEAVLQEVCPEVKRVESVNELMNDDLYEDALKVLKSSKK